jgi:hypothetical protein
MTHKHPTLGVRFLRHAGGSCKPPVFYFIRVSIKMFVLLKYYLIYEIKRFLLNPVFFGTFLKKYLSKYLEK